MFLRGVGTQRFLFSPDASVQWQPDGLTIHINKWFLGAGFLGAPPISLIEPERGHVALNRGAHWPRHCLALQFVIEIFEVSPVSSPCHDLFSPTQKGKLKRGMFFWSPISDPPSGSWFPRGHQSVTKSSLAMLIALFSLPLCFDPTRAQTARHQRRLGKGQMGSALMGPLRISCFFDRGTFLDTPVNLLLSSQKCQGVPFSPICQIHYFCSGPLVLTPFVRNQKTRPAQLKTKPTYDDNTHDDDDDDDDDGDDGNDSNDTDNNTHS